MSNLSVEYTGEATPTQGLVTTPIQAATQLLQGFVPANLTDMSTNTHFRDAVLGYVLRDAANQEQVLAAVCSALRGAADGDKVKTFSEYVAALSYSWGHPKVTVAAIARNKPENATSFIWSVAQAMSKQMPGPFYQTLLVGQISLAEGLWESSK